MDWLSRNESVIIKALAVCVLVLILWVHIDDRLLTCGEDSFIASNASEVVCSDGKEAVRLEKRWWFQK